MSTRTTGKRETVGERLTAAGFFATERNEAFIRAELQRVARQVRKLHTSEMNSEHSWAKGYSTALKDVLALLKEAGR